jgi:hypothetical protein
VQQELFLMQNMIYHLFNYLKKLGWLSIQNRLEYHKSVLMYKCINNSAPDYLCNLFDMNTNSNIYSLRSSAKGNLFVPRPNSNFMKLKKIAPSGRKRENFWGISCDPLDPPLLSQIVIFRCEYVCIVWNVFAVFDYYCFEGHRED